MSTINENAEREKNKKFVESYFATAFDADWWDRLHDDTVFEFPYAPSLGSQERLEGRAATEAYLRKMLDQVGMLKFHDIVVVGTTDPTLFVNEYKATMTTPKGTSYDQVYISKVRLKDGKVIWNREFWDPARVTKALGEFRS